MGISGGLALDFEVASLKWGQKFVGGIIAFSEFISRI
jgi:hypothetical protein